MSSFEQKTGQQGKPLTANASTTAPTTTTTTTTLANTVTANNVMYRLPSDQTFQHAAKLAIVEDKPILLDYWTDSLDKKALIGIKDNADKEKLLVKSAEEYTSPISKFYKSGTEYIIITENSIYIVASDIPNRKIS